MARTRHRVTQERLRKTWNESQGPAVAMDYLRDYDVIIFFKVWIFAAANILGNLDNFKVTPHDAHTHCRAAHPSSRTPHAYLYTYAHLPAHAQTRARNNLYRRRTFSCLSASASLGYTRSPRSQ